MRVFTASFGLRTRIMEKKGKNIEKLEIFALILFFLLAVGCIIGGVILYRGGQR
jgi:hypothetical protein